MDIAKASTNSSLVPYISSQSQHVNLDQRSSLKPTPTGLIWTPVVHKENAGIHLRQATDVVIKRLAHEESGFPIPVYRHEDYYVKGTGQRVCITRSYHRLSSTSEFNWC